ncbi:MAG TPA: superoxide dismutase family protein [Longimicrobium sp.]|nr:superoxide dismutase family protein [Longimicrobium sp.]
MMLSIRGLCAAVAVLVVSGCGAPPEAEPATEPRPVTFSIPIFDAAGRTVGTVTALQRGDSVRIGVRATGMPAGTHGAHLHDAGMCDAPQFTTAGPHLNPTARQHGMRNPRGPHLGDLPNLVVAADGTGALDATVAGSLTAGVAPIFDANGTSFVVHASRDDMVTDPSGNSGARIACAVIAAPNASAIGD